MAYVKCNRLPIPDGSTVTPTNDAQILLKCAGIFNKTSYTISDAVADTTTWTRVVNTPNAVDYLVRCNTTAFRSAVLNNTTSRQIIGANNYCSNKMIDVQFWRTGLITYDSSSYYILNVHVPTMTSNTTPSGTCSAQSQSGNTHAAWYAFDNDSATTWIASTKVNKNQTKQAWIKYDWGAGVAKRIFGLYIEVPSSTQSLTKYVLRGANVDSSDDSTYTEITRNDAVGGVTYTYVNFANNNTYRYYKLYVTCKNVSGNDSVYTPRAATVQFYGRQDV